MRPTSALTGHFWTLWPHLRDTVAPPVAPAWSSPWSATSSDERFGSAPITGVLCDLPGADTLVVIVHGLGGSADSAYAVRTAGIAAQMGLASLRVHLRGADGGGADIYHAGLAADVRAAVDSEAAEKFREVVVIGFSLGGHITLRFAALGAGRARAVAAVCSPLDLEASCAHIDSAGLAWMYRQHVLRGLRDMYRASAASPRMPRVADVDSVQTIRDWDERIVAPRFGFAGAQDYWDQMSVAPILDELTVPCLYVGSTGDPMVSAATVAPALTRSFDRLEVRWLDGGGHVGFPDGPGVMRDVLRWLVTSSARG